MSQPADGRGPAEVRRLLAVLLAVCAVQPAIWVVKLVIAPEPLFPDFFGLWSFGRYALTRAPATIYDDRLLYAFQTALGMPPDAGHYSFFYPPWTLLLFAPIGVLPYGVARVAWLVLSFALYAGALAAWRWQRPVAGLLLLAPASAVCILLGQNGFLTAALMLGGMRLLWTRPLAAGIVLGLLALKPQLGILVPFVLLFGRHWRAMAGAALCIAVLSLTSLLAFGSDTWMAWLHGIRDQAGTLTAGRQALLDMMPTVTSAVLVLGGSTGVAHLAQLAGVLAGLLAVWRVRRRRDLEARAVPPLATILATPYAFDYDLTMTTGAVLAVIAGRVSAGRFGQYEFPLLLACIMLPAILPLHFGALAAAVPLVFAATLWIMTERAGRIDSGRLAEGGWRDRWRSGGLPQALRRGGVALCRPFGQPRLLLRPPLLFFRPPIGVAALLTGWRRGGRRGGGFLGLPG